MCSVCGLMEPVFGLVGTFIHISYYIHIYSTRQVARSWENRIKNVTTCVGTITRWRGIKPILLGGTTKFRLKFSKRIVQITRSGCTAMAADNHSREVKRQLLSCYRPIFRPSSSGQCSTIRSVIIIITNNTYTKTIRVVSFCFYLFVVRG